MTLAPEGVVQTCMGELPTWTVNEPPPYLAALSLEVDCQVPGRLTSELARLRNDVNREEVQFILLNTLFANSTELKDEVYKAPHPREVFSQSFSILSA